MKCEHNAWIQVVNGRAERKIVDDQRLATLNSALANPAAQAPSIALFLGDKAKDEALRQIFPHNNFRRTRRAESVLRLRADTTSLRSQYPLYFADVDPSLFSCGLELGKSHCHPQTTSTIAWANPTSANLLDLVLSRLLFPFVDTICLFAEDCGGYDGVRDRLTKWASVALPACYPSAVRPRILVVVQDGTEGFLTSSSLQTLKHDLEQAIEANRLYSSVQVVQLAAKHLSPRSRYLRMKNELLNLLDRCRADRIKEAMLFSAVHQETLFGRAITHFARTIREPFNFIQAARYGLDENPEAIRHVETTVKLARALHSPLPSISSVLASSLLLDMYPKGMHGAEFAHASQGHS